MHIKENLSEKLMVENEKFDNDFLSCLPRIYVTRKSAVEVTKKMFSDPRIQSALGRYCQEWEFAVILISRTLFRVVTPLFSLRLRFKI